RGVICLVGPRMSRVTSSEAGTQVFPSRRPSGVRDSAFRGTSLFEKAVTISAIEMRWHSAHRTNAAVEATPGTWTRSAPKTSPSPLPPEHPQGQTLRPLAIGTPAVDTPDCL